MAPMMHILELVIRIAGFVVGVGVLFGIFESAVYPDLHERFSYPIIDFGETIVAVVIMGLSFLSTSCSTAIVVLAILAIHRWRYHRPNLLTSGGGE